MACLAELFKPCELPIKVFLLKRIADISNVNVNFIMETFLIKSNEEKKNKDLEFHSGTAKLDPGLKTSYKPIEKQFDHRTANLAEHSGEFTYDIVFK